jgi:hypothetical protein
MSYRSAKRNLHASAERWRVESEIRAAMDRKRRQEWIAAG